MNRLSSLIHRISGIYLSALILLFTHTLAVLFGVLLMFAVTVAVCAQTIPGFANQLPWGQG